MEEGYSAIEREDITTMPTEQLSKTKSIHIANLHLVLWKGTVDPKWGVTISNRETNEVLVKVYRESEIEAIGQAGHRLYSRVFHSKTLEQVKELVGLKSVSENEVRIKPSQGKSICITNLRLALWERPHEGAKWGASITNRETNKVFVKVYGESEIKAIGQAGYELYTEVFHSKTLEQVKGLLEPKGMLESNES